MTQGDTSNDVVVILLLTKMPLDWWRFPSLVSLKAREGGEVWL